MATSKRMCIPGYIYQLLEKEKKMLVYVQKKIMGVGTQPADVPVYSLADI